MHAEYSICTSYLQLIDICVQLFAGELTNQNREYYKVNDNSLYLYIKCKRMHAVSSYAIEYMSTMCLTIN